MPDGEASVTAEVPAGGDEQPCVAASTMVEPLLSLSEVNDQVEPVCDRQYAGKDPRKIARNYQLELCRKALEENIIVYLGTGCGKTHIAVLLMCEMSHLIRKPQKNICIFLAPTVALVEQQAKVVEDSTDFKVGVYCGSSKRLRCHSDWEKEIEQYEVLVMTPQILLYNLSHCFIKMDMIALLIFDECHHAQAKSNHPYAEIMKVFYKPDSTKVPRIFGMTASPVVGKGASSEAILAKSINSLEHMLNAKIYSVEEKEELDAFVASPVVKIYYYGPISNGTTSLYETYCNRLAEIKQQCMATLKSNAEEHQKRMNTKKLLKRMHDNMVFCLDNLGIWGALQASHILLRGGHFERNELVEVEEDSTDDSLCDKYLDNAAELFSSRCPKSDTGVLDISSMEILNEPLFSRKLLRLIGILSSFRVQSDMKCIIFVNRIVTARSLSYILQKLKFLSQWRSDFLVGVHSGLKSMSRKTMNTIVDKFRSGELNLLVATKVGEEGLDIQTCCLVIRFDLPETVASFIQSRGRARMPQSEYAFLVDSGNKKDLDLIANFKKDEDRMNMEISGCRTSNETFIIPEEKIFKVDSSGASVTSGYSISLLHQYCSKLPHDEYFDPKPQFFFFDDLGGTVCNITLPSNAPIHHICSAPQISTEAAKKDACLKAIEELHKLGALSDYLLPKQDDANLEEHLSVSSDSDESEDDGARGELHEMLIPSAFRQVWRNKEKIIHLNSYYIKFSPSPEDRIYKKFGLYVMTRLPPEAEKMEIDLHLAHGRSVMTNLVPFGVEEFHKDEIKMAQKFQQMFLKVILDRSEFIPNFVPLGKDVLETSLQPSYLMLPVILQDCESAMRIDWNVVRRCLSSPIFRNPEDAGDLETSPSDIHLRLANGYRSLRDIENSLVYAPHKNTFYFVTNVVREKDGFSPYKDMGTLRYVDHLIKKYSIYLKYPDQPLLHAKPLFNLHNLLHNRKHEDTEPHELEEYFIDLPPELCQLKIIGFSKDIGSSLSLLPSIMHRLGNLLVAVELKNMLLSSFPEAAEVSASRVLEALTTERCQERFSLERLEVLGDSFLKFAVSRHLFLMHESLDEGNLTRRRSNAVNNSNLLKLATRHNLQVYIRDQPFDPSQFYALGRPCQTVCTKETEESIHSSLNTVEGRGCASEVCCSKNHHWLHKKTIADVVEALVGAFLVESGFKAATAFLTWIGIKVDFEASQVVGVCKESTGYFPVAAHLDLPSLEGKLGYSFLHKGLLLQAFIHPSFNKHGGGCYQRLEFLGDAVLDYLITSYLYSSCPELKPGQLTDLRSVSVNNKAFAYVAVDRSFNKFLLCDSSSLFEAIEKYVDHIGRRRQRPVSQEPKCPKALGDVVESCVGAILIDSGFNLNCVWGIMTSFLGPIMKFSCFQLSPIRDLRELCQCHNLELHFDEKTINRMFKVEGTVTGKQVFETASTTSPNKKEGVKITSQQLFSKLKAQGLTPKSKPLEEVLKSSSKMEAKLIGYDETPVDVTTANTGGHNMDKETSSHNFDKETSSHNFDPEICLIRSPSTIPVSQRSRFSLGTLKRQLGETSKVNGSDIHSESTDVSYKGTARSQLHEFCAANYWKPPSFECCKEEGPGHLKLFTYKVNLGIEDAPDMILECIGKPHSKKKIAAEDAAEGALWFLQKQGYNSR